LQTACAADAKGWTVNFDNSAVNVSTTFVVTDDAGNAVDSVVVAAGAKSTKEYPFANVKGDKLTVATNGTVLGSGDAKTTCVNVGATAVGACDTPAGNGVLLGFTDTGKLPETFTVTRDGKSVNGSPFTIQPSNLETQKLLPTDSTATAQIKITGSSGFSYEKSVNVACAAAALASAPPPTVLAADISRSQLPFTGIDVWQLLMLGAVLIAIGLALCNTSANLAFASGYKGVKSESSGQLVLVLLAKARKAGNQLGDLFAPKGKHARRRRQ
jgi:hypothetical protein